MKKVIPEDDTTVLINLEEDKIKLTIVHPERGIIERTLTNTEVKRIEEALTILSKI